MYYNYNTMNNEIRNLVLTSVFLALCGVLSMIQIPLFFEPYAGFDLATIPLLLSRRFVGLAKACIIAIMYPFFTLLSSIPNLIGVLFLVIQSLFLVLIDYKLNKKEYKIIRISLSILLVTIVSIIINVFLIVPLYVGGFSIYWSNPIPNILIAIESSIIITPIRLIVGYLIIWPLWILIKERFSDYII